METLANKLRPNTLNNIVGQTHIVGENKILNNLVKNNKIFNMIFYGKSGIGKTTIALMLMNELKCSDFDTAIMEAKMYGDMVLIIDEIHRMNKDKQDLLLSFIESGKLTLIGLTSSNPFHSINPAIRSRCQLIELKELTENDIFNALNRVKEVYTDINLTDEIKSHVAKLSAGDLRFAYNLVEFCYNSFGPNFTIDNINEISPRTNLFYDKNEDGYYDVISAFQKSIRGSDVDASVHYLMRLIDAGDFDILYRRMLVIAYEDIGLANPTLQTLSLIHI